MRIRMTKPMSIKIILELSKIYQVRVHFVNTNPHHEGEARYWNNSLSINKNQSGVGMISTFFHELGHIHCYNVGKWKSYHLAKNIDDFTDREKKLFFLTALKAERWVDKWAKKEMKKHFPKLVYVDSYLSKESGESFRKYIKKLIKYE